MLVCVSVLFIVDLCCVCLLMIKLSSTGLVIKLKGTTVPSCQQLGLRPKSPPTW